MTCDHCARSVRSEIGKITGVDAVDVELATGVVTVTSTGDVDLVDVAAAVEEAGYTMAV
jgi:copper chaperone